MEARRIHLALFLVAVVMLSLTASAMVKPVAVKEPRIVDPQYSRPVAVQAGSEVNVTILGASSVESVHIIGFNYTSTPEFTVAEASGSIVTVTVALPQDIPPGLYGILAKTYAGTAWMPRAIWVIPGGLSCLTIMHMSDIHLGASDEGIPNTPKNTKYIMLSATLAEQMGVDLALITGDVADVGSDTESLKYIYMEYNQFVIPTFILPGNHDWAQVPGKDAFLTRYFGLYVNSQHYWYRVVGPFLIIGLDTEGSGYLPDEQLNFLEKVLSMYPDKVAIIAFHHPIFTRSDKYSGPVDAWIGSIYSSWREHEDNLRRFIDIVTAHDNVRVVLSGHIHRDEHAILNDRIHFIVTTTANHGTPTYWGFKLVKVCVNGTVSVILPPGKTDIFSGKTSFNTMYIDSYEYASDDLTTVVWDLHASRLAEVNLSNAVILFYVNGSYPASSYKLYGNTSIVHKVEYYKYGDLLVFKAYVSVPTVERAVLVMSNKEDTTPPTVSIAMVTPRTPTPDSMVLVYVKAYDKGWGIREVDLLVDTGTGWKKVGPLSSQGGYYVARIGPFKPGIVKIKAVAIDYAGLKGESDVVEIKVPAPQPVTTTPPPTTTTETPTTTPTTTTTSSPTTTTTTPTTTRPATTTAPAPTTTTPMTTISESPTTTTVQPKGGVPVYIAAIAGLVVVAILFALARRKS